MASRRPLPTIPDTTRPAPPAALSNSIGFLVNEVAGAFRVSVEHALVAHKLRPRQFLILIALRDEGPLSQHALGQRLGMDRTTTMQLVLALAERGLVDRQDDPSDRRVYLLTLTSAGTELANTLERVMMRAESALLAPLAAAERAAFAATLRAILTL
jgi:DNA-binding MarR family transcriptional regulator